MEVTFLGTSGMQPTKTRGLPAVYMSHGTDKFLIDCGEGTQRQMKLANLTPTKITRIFITHLHGDHILGLAGLFRNLTANQYNKTLEIYGPKELKEVYKHAIHSWSSKDRLKVKIIEFTKKQHTIETKDLIIRAQKLHHSITCYGYTFTEKPKRKMNLTYLKKLGLTKHILLGELQKGKSIKWNNKIITPEKATNVIQGKKLSIITDTEFKKDIIPFINESDLLIAESNFSKELESKAKQFKHMTSEQAATLAKESNSKRLILTHLSQRYKEVQELKKQAKKIFKKTQIAEDFMKVKV